MHARWLALLALVVAAAALQPEVGSVKVVGSDLLFAPPAGGAVLFNGTDVVAILAALQAEVTALNATYTTQLAHVVTLEALAGVLSANLSAQMGVISSNAALLAQQAAIIQWLSAQRATASATSSTASPV